MLLARLTLIGARSPEDHRVAFRAVSNTLMAVSGAADQFRLQVMTEVAAAELAFGGAQTSPPSAPVLIVDIQGVPDIDRQEAFRVALQGHLEEHGNFRLQDVVVSFPSAVAAPLGRLTRPAVPETPLKRLGSFLAALSS